MDLAKLNTLINAAGLAVGAVSDALSHADISAAAIALAHVNDALVGIQQLHDADAPVVTPDKPTGTLSIKKPDIQPLTGALLDQMRIVQGFSTTPSSTQQWTELAYQMRNAGYAPEEIAEYRDAYGPGGQLRGTLSQP